MHKNTVIDYNTIQGMHIHIAKEECLKARLSSDHYAVETADYTTFESAVDYFKVFINFPDLSLPFGTGDLFGGVDNAN